MNIHLGFEVATANPVSIPLDHTLITGRTRRSGKTTTLEAIVQRSGLRALTFLTKPGEDTFRNARFIRPYFHDEGGWRFVASVLEATLGEKLKMHRSEIINACKGARSLREVQSRIVVKKETARNGLVISLLTELEAYFEIVLPQIEKTPFAKTLEIGPGANVIDMSSDYSDELQALVIRSALGWVLRHERNVLTVIPEAWKFIPEERGNPVKQGCALLIRQGGVLGNWVAIDSQEITSIDKGIAKSCGTWILGVQRELNEVKRVIAQLPGKPKPTPEDVMTLGLGQFYVSYTGAPTQKVYVQPAWMDDETAQRTARGEISIPLSPSPAANERISPEAPCIGTNEEEEMAREDVEQLNRKFDEMIDLLRTSAQTGREPVNVTGVGQRVDVVPADQASMPVDEEALFQRFRTRLLKDPIVLKVLATKPEIAVAVKTETITMDGNSLPGRIARLVAQNFFDGQKRHVDVKKQLERTGPQVHNGNLSRELKNLVNKGFLTEEENGYKAVSDMKVRIVNAA